MGWLGLVISVVAVWLLWDNGGIWLAAAIAVGVIELWSWGVMHNHATNAAKNRSSYTGGFSDFTMREIDAVPNWLAMVNMVGFLAAIGLLIAGIVI